METTTATTYDVKETTWPSRTFILKRDKLPFDKLTQFFTQQYGALYGALQKKGIPSEHAPYAFYYTVDEKNNVTELAAAVQVDDPNITVPGFEKITLPASKVLSIKHTGSYESMRPAYEALEKYIGKKGMKKELMIEQYLSDPQTVKDPNKWETNIYFVVK